MTTHDPSDRHALVAEGLWLFEKNGDTGDKLYVQAIREELTILRAELTRLRAQVPEGYPFAMVDDVVTVNGVALSEVIKLGRRYSYELMKPGTLGAQVFDALVMIADACNRKPSAAPTPQKGVGHG